MYWEVANKEPWTERVSFNASRVYFDSTAAKSLTENKKISARGKHIDLRAHNVKELLLNNIIQLIHVRSCENTADLFTKILALPRIWHLSQL